MRLMSKHQNERLLFRRHKDFFKKSTYWEKTRANHIYMTENLNSEYITNPQNSKIRKSNKTWTIHLCRENLAITCKRKKKKEFKKIICHIQLKNGYHSECEKSCCKLIKRCKRHFMKEGGYICAHLINTQNGA